MATFTTTILLVFSCLIVVSFVSSASYKSWRWETTLHARLTGHVIETKNRTTLVSCLSFCLRSNSCWTVNHRASDATCELNGADHRWSDISGVTPDQQFHYYSRAIPRKLEDIDIALRADVTVCQPQDFYLNGTCLEVTKTESVTFDQAKQACDHKFGRLAILDSPELESIIGYLPMTHAFWIDIMRRPSDGTLVWGATGVEINIQHPPWHTGQPDNYASGSGPEDCGNIEVMEQALGLMDVPCTINRSYICQYDPYVYLVW